MNKGAMFGLDARIALAIFGSLSVISGAALYSAIQNANVTSLIANMNEMSKAIEHYHLDTGVDITESKAVLGAGYTYKLIENTGVAGWKGPYIAYDKLSNDHLQNGSYVVYLRIGSDETWEHPGDDGGAHHCTNMASTSTCYYWVLFKNVPENVRALVDIQVDGVASPTTGLVRDTTQYNGELYLRSMPVLVKP
ncbi:MAG: hypothetical protein CFH44_00609 [Proteobacteria bacterium]|nr:MAG: hypothetical protein CFH44_00609 [Pseudomonadota bacterium]|tara:strand:+ start:63 stop:644 length:582 start_codon:yes stop_codon:yes gene_type:complete